MPTQAIARLAEKDVFPVELSNLKPNSELGFDLYLERMQNGEKVYLLYRKQDRPFTDEVSNKLISNGIEILYAPNEARTIYDMHCAVNNPTAILQDMEKGVPEGKGPRLKRTQRAYQDITSVVLPIYKQEAIRDSVQEVQKAMEKLPPPPADTSHTRDYIRMLQEKDQALYRHSAHVAVLGVGLAKAIGIGSSKVLQLIALGGFLHDIGMLRIPTGIRQKQSPLSDAEMGLLRQHPTYGLEIVDKMPGISSQVRKVIVQHHEKCDGSGYPNGTKKEGIDISARIVSVVEIYDALTTVRSYGKVYSPKQAIAWMLRTMRDELDLGPLTGLIQLIGTLRVPDIPN